MKDHRELGREMELLNFHPSLGGEVIWYPNGLVLIDILKHYLRKYTKDYIEVSTPLLVRNEVFKISGHLAKYKENMFILKEESLKPMSCPEACLVFKLKQYKFPVRFSEFGLVHRKERSGVVGGLFRLREFTQDDGHIFCAEKDVEKEVNKLKKTIQSVYKDFGFHPEFKNDKVFYGDKQDVHIKDSRGRSWQLGTIQIDRQTPQGFGINAVLIHRALLGSLERFIGILLEHTQGKLPYWLSPVQIAYIPVSEKHNKKVKKFINKRARYVVLDSNETVSARVRKAKVLKIPVIKVIGDREKI